MNNKEVIMKNFYKTVFTFFVLIITQSAFAGYYSYQFEDNAASPKMVDTYGGNIDLPLKMNVWLKESGHILIKVEKIDGTGLPAGHLYFQKNTNGDAPEERIECISNAGSNAVNGEYVKSFLTTKTLDDIQDRWHDNTMFVYARFENAQGECAWVGPVAIQRKESPNTGQLQVILTPEEIVDDARWRFKNPDGSWSGWFKSGAVLNNMIAGSYHIQFNQFSDNWQPPGDRRVNVERSNMITSIKEIYKIKIGGGIQFMIRPEEAVQAGAKCRAKYPSHVGYSEWLENSEVALGFDQGLSEIECLGIDEWVTPELGNVMIPVDEPIVVSITYCKTTPYKPQNVIATQGVFINKVVISWDPVACVSKYDIYRSTDNVFTSDERIAKNYSDIVFSDMDADPSCKYFYSVVGINDNGAGEFSAPVTGFSRLDVAKNLEASDGIHTTKICLNWDAVHGADYYQIWRNSINESNVAINIADNVSATGYEDTSAIPEKAYYYWVKAMNSFNSSNFSDGDHGTRELGIPSGLKASVLTFDDHIVVSWNPVNGASSYHVSYALADSKKRKSQYVSTIEPETVFLHYGAIPGQRYYYKVSAQNPFGKSEYSALIFGCQDMMKPKIFASKRTYENKIRVSWTDVKDATGYRLYRSDQDDFSTAQIFVDHVIGLYKDDPTLDTRTFFYWVEARNDYTTKLSDPAKGYIGNGCEFQLSQTELEIEAAGAVSGICIETDNNNCEWDAETLDNWLSLTSQTSGMGNACLDIQVQPSNTADPRTGNVRIAGQDVIVRQAGLNTFVLSMNKTGPGEVKINDKTETLPYIGRFVLNEAVKIEAIPCNEWQFDYFSGNMTQRENPMILHVNQDMSIMAEFSPIKHFVSISCEGAGIISINNEETTSGSFAKGERIVLQASPENQFSGWTGDIERTDNPLIMTVENDLSIIGNFKGWTIDILAKGLNLGGLDKSQVTIGLASRNISVSAPPLPPNFSSYVTLKHDINYLNRQIFQQGEKKYMWIMAVNPKGNMGVMDEPATTILSWDSNLLKNVPEIIEIQLIKGGDGTGDVLIDDMRHTASYEIYGTNEDIFLSIVLTIKSEETPYSPCMDIDLAEGWNLVSMPVTPDTQALTNIFADAEIAYGYTNGAYFKASQMLVNEGYWVKMPFAKSYQVCGAPVHSYNVDLSKGWHLKGCTNTESIPGSTNDQIEVMYEYRQGAYIRIDACTPGYAFWVRLKEADRFFVFD